MLSNTTTAAARLGAFTRSQSPTIKRWSIAGRTSPPPRLHGDTTPHLATKARNFNSSSAEALDPQMCYVSGKQIAGGFTCTINHAVMFKTQPDCIGDDTAELATPKNFKINPHCPPSVFTTDALTNGLREPVATRWRNPSILNEMGPKEFQWRAEQWAATNHLNIMSVIGLDYNHSRVDVMILELCDEGSLHHFRGFIRANFQEFEGALRHVFKCNQAARQHLHELPRTDGNEGGYTNSQHHSNEILFNRRGGVKIADIELIPQRTPAHNELWDWVRIIKSEFGFQAAEDAREATINGFLRMLELLARITPCAETDHLIDEEINEHPWMQAGDSNLDQYIFMEMLKVHPKEERESTIGES